MVSGNVLEVCGIDVELEGQVLEVCGMVVDGRCHVLDGRGNEVLLEP